MYPHTELVLKIFKINTKNVQEDNWKIICLNDAWIDCAMYAGSECGFLENSLLVFKVGLITGDYHGHMKSTNFEKCVSKRIFPQKNHHTNKP